MDILRLFRPMAEPLRAPTTFERHLIAGRILTLSSEALRDAAHGDLKTQVELAMRSGGGILQIGLSPHDMEIDGLEFCVRCDLRLTGCTRQVEIMIKGVVDESGCLPILATLLALDVDLVRNAA